MREYYTDDNMNFRLFAFTNEMLKEYIPLMDVKDKDALTVVGSGDQALNLVLQGAKSVDTFDINIEAKYYMDLKIAALSILSIEEFKMFLANNNITFKEYNEFYNRIREVLPSETRAFFDKNIARIFILLNYNSDIDYGQIKPKFFNNAYVTEENYYLLREKLKECPIKFINSNLLTLPCKLDKNKKYNAILCSNISNYIPYNSYQYRKFIKKELMPFVNQNGIIQYAYYYNAGEPIYFFPQLNKFKTITEIPVNPGLQIGDKDAVAFMKRLRP